MGKDQAVLLTPFSQQGVTFYYYRPQTKLRQGNVFTRVCQEFCPPGGSGRQPLWTDIPLGRHPPGQTPPAWADTPLARHSPWQTPPSADGYCSGRYASYWNAFL